MYIYVSFPPIKLALHVSVFSLFSYRECFVTEGESYHVPIASSFSRHCFISAEHRDVACLTRDAISCSCQRAYLKDAGQLVYSPKRKLQIMQSTQRCLFWPGLVYESCFYPRQAHNSPHSICSLRSSVRLHSTKRFAAGQSKLFCLVYQGAPRDFLPLLFDFVKRGAFQAQVPKY